MSSRSICLAFGLAVVGFAGAGAAAPKPPWRTPPIAAARVYHYEVREIRSDTATGYRMDFRLRTDGKGGVVSEVIRAETFGPAGWAAAQVDADCARALGAQPGELATVRLYPLSPEEAKLGEAFMAPCAPPGLFFPMTDILNVVLVTAAERFRAGDLARVGQSADFPGFETSLDRLGHAIAESSDGGQITLAALDEREAQIDWKPTPSRLLMTETTGSGAMKISGTEHFAFRVAVERRTGLLARAKATYDDLDLTVQVPALPPERWPKVAIRREVEIRSVESPAN